MFQRGRLALLFVALLPACCAAEGEIHDISVRKVVKVSNLHEWKYIVLHHSATETGDVESIDAAHKLRKDANGNPWRGIGYHFLIGNGHGMKDGEVASTFRWHDQSDGAHAGNSRYNTQGIGICLVGNFEDAPPTPAQLKTLHELMVTLRADCRIRSDGIVRHTDIKQTACPGKQFPWEAFLSSMESSSKEKRVPAKLVRTGQSD